MAVHLETTPEELAARLTESFHENIYLALKKELLKQAEPVIEQIARDLARNVAGRIKTFRAVGQNNVQVIVALDGIEKWKKTL